MPRPYEVSLSSVSGLDCCWRGPGEKKKLQYNTKKVRPHQIWPAKVTTLPIFRALTFVLPAPAHSRANSTETVHKLHLNTESFRLYILWQSAKTVSQCDLLAAHNPEAKIYNLGILICCIMVVQLLSLPRSEKFRSVGAVTLWPFNVRADKVLSLCWNHRECMINVTSTNFTASRGFCRARRHTVCVCARARQDSNGKVCELRHFLEWLNNWKSHRRA